MINKIKKNNSSKEEIKMKVCGIIAEYNPFHNGHAYHIERTKEQTNCDAIVAVMSGNFVQRGAPALFDKWTRTEMALKNGIDLVVELPVYYATSSAEYFAQGSIGLLDSLGIVNDLSFGAKTKDLDALKRIANILYLEPNDYKSMLQSELKKGYSYPVARGNALKSFTKKEFDSKYISEILMDSNNILGIEYLKALMYNNSIISPNVVLRKGEDYNSVNIVDGVCSATAIRQMLNDDKVQELQEVMPENSFDILSSQLISGKAPMNISNFEKEIFYVLRKNLTQDLFELADVSEGLENVLKKASNETTEIEKMIEMLKSKRYTRTRIQRILIHALLDITKDEVNNYKYNPQYIRVLGFTKNGEKLLSQIYNKSNLPIVTSVSKFLKSANETGRRMIEKDILATNIYTLGYQIPNYRESNLDYTKQIVQI